MRTYTLLFSAWVLVACGDGSTPTNQPDVIVAPDADTSGGDATPDTAGDVPGDTDAGDPDGDGGADASDAADTSETGGDADATTELPDTTGDADVTPEVTDCASLADACDKANDVRCAPSGPVTAQQCVLKDGCLQWLDAAV